MIEQVRQRGSESRKKGKEEQGRVRRKMGTWNNIQVTERKFPKCFQVYKTEVTGLDFWFIRKINTKKILNYKSHAKIHAKN